MTWRRMVTVVLACGWGVLASTALADPSKAIPDHGPVPSWLSKGAVFSGPVAYVGDGDSLCVDVGRRMSGSAVGGEAWVEVRLADFYAPELSTEGGEAAKAALTRLVRGRAITCIAGRRSYDRIVASCTLNGAGVGEIMRREGVSEGGRGVPAGR